MNQDELAALREEAKKKYFEGETDSEITEGLALLVKAANLSDPEANYLLGDLLVRKKVFVRNADPIAAGLNRLTRASDLGCQEARLLLNSICQTRYRKAMKERATFDGREKSAPHPLTDFNGKEITIDRKGVFIPVDAKLSFENGQNILTLSANLKYHFYGNETEEELVAFMVAVEKGIKDWEGVYSVFEDQQVRVVIHLTYEDRLLDNVNVFKITDAMSDSMADLYDKLPQTKNVERMRGTVADRRSFAMLGLGTKWSVSSPKQIFIMLSDEDARNSERVRNTARHEFGHVLGLGDLYEDRSLSLAGVEKNQYAELDAFHLYDRRYHQVMCDPSAPVSNNDIEMVILAFSKNRYQRFQEDQTGTIISDALGLGN